MTTAIWIVLIILAFCVAFLLLRDYRKHKNNLEQNSWFKTGAIGFVGNFFDTLGIGSFAIETPMFKFLKQSEDRLIPGTLNVANAIPTVAQAIIFINIVEVEPVTLVLMIAASGFGALLGSGIVAKLSETKIRFTMGIALFVAAGFMIAAKMEWINKPADKLFLISEDNEKTNDFLSLAETPNVKALTMDSLKLFLKEEELKTFDSTSTTYKNFGQVFQGQRFRAFVLLRSIDTFGKDYKFLIRTYGNDWHVIDDFEFGIWNDKEKRYSLGSINDNMVIERKFKDKNSSEQVQITDQGKVIPKGEIIGLEGNRLIFAVAVNFILGALMTAGIGLYAPCMALVFALGMSPTVAFPIMMGSCAFLMSASSFKFIKEGAYNRRAAVIISITGTVAVLVAAPLVGSLDVGILGWVVICVIIYTATVMLRAALRKNAA